MKKLIIYGIGDMAEMAFFYFKNDSDFEVIAFTVDKEYVDSDSFHGLPVIPIEEVFLRYPAASGVSFFIAIGYSNLNVHRKEKYNKIKNMGYSMAKYISSRAIVMVNNTIGDNCFILEGSIIQPFAKIGNNVILYGGCLIGHHSFIHDHTCVAACAVIAGRAEIGEQCFIGLNATVRDNIKIGDRCIVGAGTLVLKSIPSDGLYIGKSTSRAVVPSSAMSKI